MSNIKRAGLKSSLIGTSVLVIGGLAAIPAIASAQGSAPACKVANLRLADFHGGGSGDVAYYTPTVSNTGSASCSLTGFPTLQLRDASGAALPTNVADGVPQLSEDQSGATITLAPGAQASATFAYRDDPTLGSNCVTASSVDVGIPQGGSINLPRELSPCDGDLAVTSFQLGDSLPY